MHLSIPCSIWLLNIKSGYRIEIQVAKLATKKLYLREPLPGHPAFMSIKWYEWSTTPQSVNVLKTIWCLWSATNYGQYTIAPMIAQPSINTRCRETCYRYQGSLHLVFIKLDYAISNRPIIKLWLYGMAFFNIKLISLPRKGPHTSRARGKWNSPESSHDVL